MMSTISSLSSSGGGYGGPPPIFGDVPPPPASGNNPHLITVYPEMPFADPTGLETVPCPKIKCGGGAYCAGWSCRKVVATSDINRWICEIVTIDMLQKWWAFKDNDKEDELHEIATRSLYLRGPCAHFLLRKMNKEINKGIVDPDAVCKDTKDSFQDAEDDINEDGNPRATHHFHILFPEGTIFDNSFLSKSSTRVFSVQSNARGRFERGSVLTWKIGIAGTRKGGNSNKPPPLQSAAEARAALYGDDDEFDDAEEE